MVVSVSMPSVSAISENVTYESILGVYEGTYTPSDGVLRGATVLVFMNNNNCQAVFHFYPTAEGGNSYSGSYLMDVNVDAVSGYISLKGVQWINQPSSYIFADFVVYQDGEILKGDSSSSIVLQKVATTSYYYHGPHDHLFESELVTVEPTCTENGYTEGLCSICSNLIKSDIESTGHQTINWYAVDEASCIKIGKESSQCEKCGNTIYRETGKLAHRYQKWEVSKYASCNSNGIETRRCEFCDAFEERETPQLVHNYSEWIIASGSKLIPPITKERTCELCGDVEQTQDWSYVWVTVIAGIAAIGVIIGLISYVRAFKRK